MGTVVKHDACKVSESKHIFVGPAEDKCAHRVDISLKRHMFYSSSTNDDCVSSADIHDDSRHEHAEKKTVVLGPEAEMSDDVDDDVDAGSGSGNSICVRSVGSRDESHIEGSADDEHDVGSFEEWNDAWSFEGKSNVVGSDPSSSRRRRQQRPRR